LKHVRDWSYEDLTREVRANLVNPETLITMQEIGTILGYQDRGTELVLDIRRRRAERLARAG
jgi:hypothetical protein